MFQTDTDRWNGYAKLPPGVSEWMCASVVLCDALNPIQGVFLPHDQCFCVGLWIQQEPGLGKAGTDD